MRGVCEKTMKRIIFAHILATYLWTYAIEWGSTPLTFWLLEVLWYAISLPVLYVAISRRYPWIRL